MPRESCIADSGKRMNDSNRDQLKTAAETLRPLLGELVFVGGCVTGLLITDEAAGDPRSTLDVDAIAEINPTLNTRSSGTVCARWDSGRIPVRTRLCAAGFIAGRYSTLCRWMKRFWVSLTAGIRQQ